MTTQIAACGTHSSTETMCWATSRDAIRLIRTILLKAGLIGVFCGFFADYLAAGDWPQILGPDRNGVARDETLLAWGPDGPPTVWKRNVGEGFAGVAVAQDRVIMFHRQGDR